MIICHNGTIRHSPQNAEFLDLFNPHSLGTVEDIVQRALQKLEASHLIEVNRQQIKIVNRVGLEELGI